MYKKEKVVVKIKVIYSNKPINAKKEGRFVTGKAISLLSVMVVVMVGIRLFCTPESFGNFSEVAEAFAEDTSGSSDTCMPVFGGEITSGYSARQNPLDNESYEFHRGIDITSDNDDNIYAYADGVVGEVGEDTSYGKYLFITHKDGTETFYAHCSQILVSKGECVKVSDAIAVMGDTGQSAGKHLHFELHIDGKAVDPAEYLK